MGVAAMAAQSALVQLALKGAPARAVMTTNISRFIMGNQDRTNQGVIFGSQVCGGVA